MPVPIPVALPDVLSLSQLTAKSNLLGSTIDKLIAKLVPIILSPQNITQLSNLLRNLKNQILPLVDSIQQLMSESGILGKKLPLIVGLLSLALDPLLSVLITVVQLLLTALSAMAADGGPSSDSNTLTIAVDCIIDALANLLEAISPLLTRLLELVNAILNAPGGALDTVLGSLPLGELSTIAKSIGAVVKVSIAGQRHGQK